MRNFILRRLLQTLPMLLLASFIIFMLFAKTPGDFIDGNITLTAARAAELKAIYGLDQPLFTRYLHWLGQLLRGDLGFRCSTRSRSASCSTSTSGTLSCWPASRWSFTGALA
jgi:ABC-type dipeptide/oligopeptide/nickel transport system permease component